MPRHDGRSPTDLRPVKITRGFTKATPGSVLYESGRTKVLVTASVEDRVPPWMQGRGQGWLTAEYSMLPGSTPDRKAARHDDQPRRRPHPRDPAPHRPLAPIGARRRGAGRANRLDRLRRPRGRRRDPHRRDQRRLPRRGRRDQGTQVQQAAHPLAAQGPDRRDLGGRRRLDARRRPRLHGGQATPTWT